MKPKINLNDPLCNTDGQQQYQPFPKQFDSKSYAQKLPIKNRESKTNISSNFQLQSEVGSNKVCEPLIIDIKRNNFDDFGDSRILGSSTESILSFQSSESGIPNYHRLSIFGEDEILLKSEEIDGNSKALLSAIKMRRRYMNASRQPFHNTTNRYLSLMESDGGAASVDSNGHHKTNRRLTIPKDNLQSDLSCHAPSTQGDPYKIPDKFPDKLSVEFQWKNGVMIVVVVSETFDATKIKCQISYLEFVKDYHFLSKFISNGPLNSFCCNRLAFIKYQFKMHILLNEWKEIDEQKSVRHRDFYNIRKVDTHVHASSCMNQKHLLRFIKKSIKQFPNEQVMLDKTTGKPITLVEVCELTGLTPYDLTIDKLDVHSERETFHRFDKFNVKYNPVGQGELRDIFLKSDNYNKGKFFAQIIKEVMKDLEDSKYQNAELRLSIYGYTIDEWDKLAKWAVAHSVYSDSVKWLIQFPRIYDIFRTKSIVRNFQEIIYNIFMPLFEVTRDPSTHPELYVLLNHVSGFDSVDDESTPESCVIDKSTPAPENWIWEENPPYSYYLYYTYANMSVLNDLRSRYNLTTFTFRPHCGETGSAQHLAAGFLLGASISHGLLLKKSSVFQYLYYLCQIGIAMSPLSNNYLFPDYQSNPLYEYMCCGLHVSLSTDDPLQFHFTKEPLMEEYSIAAQLLKLSSSDMCELARNSVLMSGFSDRVGLEPWVFLTIIFSDKVNF